MVPEERLRNLPGSPGVYLLKNAEGTVIYVGKAKNLRNRVRSYFQDAMEGDERRRALVARIADLEVLVTATEKEAFLLENTFIKQHHPRYNIKLRDDKNYLCLRLAVTDPFPRISVVRQIRKDRAAYFGPFASAKAARDTMKFVERVFRLRECGEPKFRQHRERPCILFQIGRCSGPCCGRIDEAAYHELVEQARLFLQGRNRDLVATLRQRMAAEAEALNFEAAARLRDRIASIEKTIERQQVVSAEFLDQDVVGLYREGGQVLLQLLFVRAGTWMGSEVHTFTNLELPDAEVLASFLSQYYAAGRFVPQELLLPVELEEAEGLGEWLTDLKGRKVEVLAPKRGSRRDLVDLARENAATAFRDRYSATEAREVVLEDLRTRLRLSRLPRRIEAFDISNVLGQRAVGSLVVFRDGRPDPAAYRSFRIRTVEGADDYAMMYEVLKRRYSRAKAEGDLPDLILVDGGKGQLNIALGVLRELDIQGPEVCSVVKPPEEPGKPGPRTKARGEDRVYLPQLKDPLTLPRNSSALFLLQQVRDEAHRFAITFHRKLRRREELRSILDEIPGVGGATKRKLLRHFGSLKGVREASLDALLAVPNLPRPVAERVYATLHPERAPAAAEPPTSAEGPLAAERPASAEGLSQTSTKPAT
ncbi:MAG: excinuclease ABC subunit UvrC [Deltaproteobacteria bacterium]|nr:excinuclease ABC subunit UvrC [Deltaproteobacteria bacterium]